MTRAFILEVAGEFACFTRPEMKVERVSYDVMTPSAARAVFESILWKPALRWSVRKVEVLTPIRWISVRRNEVGSKVSVSNVQAAANLGRGKLELAIEEDRQQRAGLFLRDVAYRIHADMHLATPEARANPVKYFDMFERRAEKGQCVNQPYLGCREFAARFRYLPSTEGEPHAIEETRDLGWMLYDLDFSRTGDPQPKFFRASMVRGVVDVTAGEVRR